MTKRQTRRALDPAEFDIIGHRPTPAAPTQDLPLFDPPAEPPAPPPPSAR